MAVSYTIEAGWEHSVHECPMCGTAYTIEALKTINHFTRPHRVVLGTNFLVTDNCECHNDHEAEEEQALWDAETQTWKG